MTMTESTGSRTSRIRRWTIGLSSFLVVLAISLLTLGANRPSWPASLIAWFRGSNFAIDPRGEQHGDHPLDDHDHDHGSDGAANHEHAEGEVLVLSTQAMESIGLNAKTIKPITLQTFQRTITVPALVVERPGRTRLEVATPMAGVVTHVHAVQGEAVTAGSLLFEIRITAEELVSTQTELLKTIGELGVENREITRLTEVTRAGGLPQKTLIERQYAKEKLEVLLAAQKEALRLQGLSDRQIQEIVENRHLLRDLKIVAPERDDHSHHDELRLTETLVVPISYTTPAEDDRSSEIGADIIQGDRSNDHPASLILQEVLVHKGEIVRAGVTLAVVSDMSELYIEGHAFEQDVDLLTAATTKNWKVTALFERGGQHVETISNLDLLYSASEIDVKSRTLRFYVRLPNQVVRDVPSPNGQRFIEWKYRIGQRLQIRVPVEEWPEQVVLPVDAVAQDGAETFVFGYHEGHFDRIPVTIRYRDQSHVVIKHDRTIHAGVVIAHRGAHQLQMALKNKSGGGVDPHAGHSH